jgi:hypothetical protein
MSDRSPRSIIDRLLSLAGAGDSGVRATRLAAFRRFLLLAIAVEHLDGLHYWRTQPAFPVELAIAIVLAVCAVGAWFRRVELVSLLAATAAALAHLVVAFPGAANHHHLHVLLLLLLCLFHRDGARGHAPALQCLRWVTVIGLLWSGLQKVLYGYYFNGSFLAFLISKESRFADFFSLAVPAEEITRLRGLEFVDGAGPYLVESFPLVLMSWLTWIIEIVPVLLLLVPRLRAFAVLVLIAFVLTIELGARELFFGALMVNLLLLFLREDWNRRLLPLFAGLLLYMLAMSAGLLPRWYFT